MESAAESCERTLDREGRVRPSPGADIRSAVANPKSWPDPRDMKRGAPAAPDHHRDMKRGPIGATDPHPDNEDRER